MRDWGVMLGGLLVWALHFLLVYGVASLADISAPSTISQWRWLGGGLTGLCLLALILIVLRSRGDTGLSRQIGVGGCVISGIAIAWQGIPLFISA